MMMSRSETLTELLLDDSFQSWALSGRQENNQHWEQWMRKHPDGTEISDEAVAILQALQHTQQVLPRSRKELLRHRIIAVTQSGQATSDNDLRKKRMTRTWSGIAVACVVLFTAGLATYHWADNSSDDKQYATTYGEIKTILLPDSSKVTLNGNSTMRYFRQADQPALPREVWLTGEAFFEVSKRTLPTADGYPQAVKFIVHTDQLSVQVLGTRFNVRHRRDQTQVVLEEGTVQLALDEQEPSWLMSPDELVEIHTGEKQINPHAVKAEDYTAWKEGFIHFDGASFSEISRVLEDNYDLRIRFNHKEQADSINLTGSFPANRISMLLEAVANVTRTTMHQEGKAIIYQ